MSRTRVVILSLLGAALLAAALVPRLRAVPPGPPAPAAPAAERDVVVLPPSSPQLLFVKTEPAEAGSEAPVLVTGRLAWDEDATCRVYPPVGGRVTRIAATQGARVAAGGLLATISAPDLGQAQADASRAESDLALAQKNRDRLALLAGRGAAPRKEFDAAEADLARARAEAERSRAKLARWGGSARSVDQLFPLTSPLAGVVVEKGINPGQEVRPDAPAPLFTVTDPSRLWVLLDLPEKELGRAVRGASLTLRATAFPDRTFGGALELVGDALDPATRTVKARGRVPNPGRLLKAEMYVTVAVADPAPRAGVVVPARSVLTEGARHVTFVEEAPGRFRRVPVEVGIERDGRIFVREGLAPGRKVVTDGSLLVAALLAERSGG